ncbi:metallophosphoesterase [Halonotius sp. GCM10025705]|uniref:metallophosphoesterase n=1 Tax=Halonotius sp. GCM10025705 TaxID=3252678 RepID=UPI00360BF111
MTDTADSVSEFDGRPPIVEISDIHGYLEDARSALLTIGDTDGHEPIITVDDSDTIHWADNDYVLVINGDVIDRGPDNKASLEMVLRLISEAPAGRVQYHIGNHEMPILVPAVLSWRDTYSHAMAQSNRESFLNRVIEGEVTAAFEGHSYVYSHAGSNEAFDPQEINEQLRAAAEELLDAIGEPHEPAIQEEIVEQYNRIFELGEGGGRGPSAGLCWLDFRHIEESAPPQIVGHSMHTKATRKGDVVCGNVIRQNQRSQGGEGVLMETPGEVKFFHRTPNGSVGVEVI